MNVHYISRTQNTTLETSDFYYDIANLVSQESLDCGEVRVECPEGYVIYMIRPRSGTMFITELTNTLPNNLLPHSIPSKYLTCVDPEKNAYKFYKLELYQEEVKASYGRMGVNKGELFGERSYMYPKSMFWIKYFEKIRKGYIDQTDLYLAPEVKNKKQFKKQLTASSPSSELFHILKNYAKTAVKKAEVNVPITQPIINKSKELLVKMRTATTVESFNDCVLSLISILQRPVRTGDGSGVKMLLANSKSDFPEIIQREEDLIQAMEGTNYSYDSSSFDAYDIEVYEASEKQRKQVLDHLSPSLVPRVKKIYRVIPNKQSKIFNDYLKKNKISKVKQFWHGSRNQNWLSIVKNSLSLNPNAIITGKMFGDGLYFAPDSLKSWGYTDKGKWTCSSPSSDIAIMGLYATAYGTPYDVHSWSSCCDYKKDTMNHNCNCCHAHAGSSLRADEIIFYHSEAVLLQYICILE